MRKVVIIGVGMTKFGKFFDTSLDDLGRVAIWRAIKDAGVNPKDIGVSYVANALNGIIHGWGGTLGQHILVASGFSFIPIINVENACAGGSTALRGAYIEVASGMHDVALAVGAEKLYHPDISKSIKAMAGGTHYDGDWFQFTAEYALFLRRYMKKFDVTPVHFAKIVEKNSFNGSLNPYAQYQKPLSVEEVLNSKMIAEPLTSYMCCSMGDGAAAAIVCSEDVARKYTDKPLVEIAACTLISGRYKKENKCEPDLAREAAKEAYESAGIGPEDINVAEVHDGMAPAELLITEHLGLCKPGEGAHLIDEGRTKISGDIPVNPSGGLAAKGHPVSATGLAQAAEIVWQLRGEAGERQTNNPKVGLTENAGGLTEYDDNAACAVTILKR